jgi:hypothetical protein
MHARFTVIGTLGRTLGSAAFAAVVTSVLVLTGVMVPEHAEEARTRLSLHAAAESSPLLAVVEQTDILPKHQLIADQVLRALPDKCRSSLQSLYVNYDKKNKNRGLGGESVIIVSGNVPDVEFRALLVHECGHVVDLGGLRGSPEAGQSAYKDGTMPIFLDDSSIAFYQLSWSNAKTMLPGATQKNFVSGYAMKDPFEDFAETFAYYALQQKEFKKLAEKNPVLRAKYAFMEQVVFSGMRTVALGKHVRGKSAPWDVTRLPYVWIAKA